MFNPEKNLLKFLIFKKHRTFFSLKKVFINLNKQKIFQNIHDI